MPNTIGYVPSAANVIRRLDKPTARRLLDASGALAGHPRPPGCIQSPGSDIDILVEMDPADGNLLMRASGLMEETRALFGRDDNDVFPVQLLKRPVSTSALAEALRSHVTDD